jgi:hypothetical protein
MRINFDKSDLLTTCMEEDRVNEYSKIFCCKKGEFPIKYLVVPLYFTNLIKEDLHPIIDKIIKRIAGWKGRLLSYAGRLTLLKACLVVCLSILCLSSSFPSGSLPC